MMERCRKQGFRNYRRDVVDEKLIIEQRITEYNRQNVEEIIISRKDNKQLQQDVMATLNF